MPDSDRRVLQHRRDLVASALADCDLADVDDVLRDHPLMHLFSAGVADCDPDELPRLGDEERQLLARSVLTELLEILDEAIADLDAGERLVVASVLSRGEATFTEMFPAIPGTVERFRAMSGRAESWLVENPEVVQAMLDGAVAARLTPEELITALLSWTSSCDIEERLELHERFRGNPAGAVGEVLARAVLSHQLNTFDGTFGFDAPDA